MLKRIMSWKRILFGVLSVILLVGLIPSAKLELQAQDEFKSFSNFDYTFQTIDGKTVSSTANGKPKALIFFNTVCGYSVETITDIVRVSDCEEFDIMAIDVRKHTKEEVTEFRNAYAKDYKRVQFCYSVTDEYNNYLWKYLGKLNNMGGVIIYPVIVYIDANNIVQYIEDTYGTYGGSGDYIHVMHFIDNLKEYCNLKTEINVVPLKPEVYKITNVVSSVHLYWNKTAGSGEYLIERFNRATDEVKVFKFIKDTHFLDTTVESGETYRYRIYNVSWIENNLYDRHHSSDTYCVTYVSTPDITMRTNRSTGIGLSWNKIKGATGYAVYRRTYWGTDPWVRVATITNPNTLSWTDTSVKDINGKAYRYTVRALAGSDRSILSGCRSTGRTMVRMTTRTLCSVNKVTANSVKCHWMPTKHCDGYEVRFMDGDKVYKTYKVDNYQVGFKTFAGLKSGKTYKIQVRSYKKLNNVGTFYSAWSNAKYISL